MIEDIDAAAIDNAVCFVKEGTAEKLVSDTGGMQI